MSVDAVIARIAQLNSVLAPQPATPVSTPQTAAPANATFASLMGQATTGTADGSGAGPVTTQGRYGAGPSSTTPSGVDQA